ncbi:MAG: hypothetical protein C5B54_10410 [Acidobacteria bacterium]|nr:MAG: hypothetical protein C5B54_10410 [Acidobacteriota bacterium]
MGLELTRREMLKGAIQTGAVVGLSKFLVRETFAVEQSAAAKNYTAAFEQLDKFIEQYLRSMNAPGMILSIANRDSVLRTAVYGFSDLEQKLPVQSDQLFQIGSISKSFAALICLQLFDEGKLDLKKPILEYLPWFRMQSSYTVTVHHLLTHTSGLPDNPPVFLSDPNAKHETGFAPGESFHYCNMGFELLGHLISTLDGRPWNDSLRKRIFEPLEMTSAESRITSPIRAKTAKNYSPFLEDRPYPRNGRLAEAAAFFSDSAAGSVSSTAKDMGKYMAMIVNKGMGPKGRIISEESFAKFSTAYIKAEDFSPTSSYGYGIAVDTLDQHKILRHTGGMISFMSAIQMDLDEGVGVFASINAQQGYRPNPVCMYGLQLMRAANEQKDFPKAPDLPEPTKIESASDYEGIYTAEDGSKLEFVATNERLFLNNSGQRLAVENTSSGMIVRHPDFEIYPFIFNRGKDDKGPATDVGHGDRFYMGKRYSGERHFEYPKEWDAYTGFYRNDNPWVEGTRIVVRQGKLWIDGQLKLEQSSDGRFRDVSGEKSPEWITFHDIVNGKAMRIKFSGEDLWRVSL